MNRTRDFLVGLTFFGLITVLAVLTVFLSDFSLGAAPTLTVSFDNVGGLSEGARIEVDGLDSGRVSHVERRRGETRIRVTLSFEAEPLLYGDADFEIASASPLGGRVVTIRSGDPAKGPYRADPEKIWHGPGPNLLDAGGKVVDDLKSEVSALVVRVDGVVPKIGEFIDNANRTVEGLNENLNSKDGLVYLLLRDRALRERFQTIVTNLDEGSGAFRALIGDEKLMADLRNTLDRLSRLATRLEEERGTVHKLITDPGLYDDLRTAAATLKQVLSAKSGFGSFLANDRLWNEKLAPIADSLSVAAANLAKATESLSNEKTLLGMLLLDETAGPEVRNAIASLSTFIEATRENAPITTFAGILLSPF